MRLTLIFILCMWGFLFAQNDMKLVVLSTKVGDEIDRFERDQYGLFPEVTNFISAQFYRKGDGSYRLQIKYFKDNEVETEIRILSNEYFFSKYYSQFNYEKKERKTKKLQPVKRLLNFRLTDGTKITGSVDSLRHNKVYLETADPEKGKGEIQIPLNDIEVFSVVRSTNVAAGIGLGAVPGLVAASILYLNGETEEDISNSTQNRMTKFFFVAGEIIGISIGGTIAALRGIDYDFPIAGKSIEEKQQAILNTQNYKVRMRSKLRVGSWFGVYNSPSGLNDYAQIPGIRLTVVYSPRMRMELMYGYSSWFGKTHKQEFYDYTSEPEFTQSKNLQMHLFRFGFRTDFSSTRPVNPFITWGWGILNMTYDRENDDNFAPLVTLDAGIEHHISEYLSIETRLGLIENIDYGLEFLFQVGLHFGRFY